MMVFQNYIKITLEKNEIKNFNCFHSLSVISRAHHKTNRKMYTQITIVNESLSQKPARRQLIFISAAQSMSWLCRVKICLRASRFIQLLILIFLCFLMKGREQPTSELAPILARLSKHHAEAVKLRVKALNRTVRGRTRSRHTRKKPDIRDVFRDVEVRLATSAVCDRFVNWQWFIEQTCSTGSRSRSATPDSLDSLPDQDQWNNGNQIPSFVSIFDNSPAVGARAKQNLRRTPSAPLRGSAELFRGSHIRCDIPCFTADGIELLNFQRLGTIHIPRIRSGSDPSCTIG